MRSITWLTPAGYGYGVIATMRVIRVNDERATLPEPIHQG
jgi:hypothetical protein